MAVSTSQKIVIAVFATAIAVAGAVGGFIYWRGGKSFDALSSSLDAQQQPPQLPHMQLQQQFAGPLAGTAIQRWRDPVDGTICYIYTPMVVHHETAPSGYVQYGSNAIGSIACLPGPIVPAAPAVGQAQPSLAPAVR